MASRWEEDRARADDIEEQTAHAQEKDTGRNGNPKPGNLPSHISKTAESKVFGKKIKVYRHGCNPFLATLISLRSTNKLSAAVNILLPFIPAAIAVHFAMPKEHLIVFILNYIAMVPAANLLATAAQALSERLPRVAGIFVEIGLGNCVEIVLFIVLLVNDQFQVIQAAILGSILANLLLVTGSCFIAGGIIKKEQTFSEHVAETGGSMLLISAFGLIMPAAFFESVKAGYPDITAELLDAKILKISRATAVILLVSYVAYLWYNFKTHHAAYDEVLRRDEEDDEDRHKDRLRPKLTLPESMALGLLALALVSLHAIFLVEQIHHIVEEQHISDAFVGLILVPLVEKAAEHIIAVDEAWDEQMDFALSHVLGSTIMTSLLCAPIVIIVAWGLNKPLDFNFEIFLVVVVLLAILVAGNFIRDRKSSWLEGFLMVALYVLIAFMSIYYPNPVEGSESAGAGEHGSETTTGAAAEATVEHRMLW